MNESGVIGQLGDVAYLVVRQDLLTGGLSVLNATGYGPGARGEADQDAQEAAAIAKQEHQATLHAVLTIKDVNMIDAPAQSWLWVSQTSYGGETWSNERLGGESSFAGIGEGPQRAEDAAVFFLQKRLSELAPDFDEYQLEDDWFRVCVWNTSRADETQHPAEGGRIGDRAAVLATGEKLAWFGDILRTDRVHPDAVATATPRQVTTTITQALRRV